MPKKMTVLIVDDDRSLRKTLSDILKAKGYHCVACDNEKSALNEVKNNAFSVALIDLKLPNASGLEAMEKINSLYILNEIHRN